MVTPSRPPAETGRLHLLVADEDRSVRAACCEIASSLGFVSKEASTISAARAVLRGQGIDVLLLDLRAPSAEGLDLVDEVKTLDPDICVVIMTSFASIPFAVESMRSGATDYLAKPFSKDELASVLERITGRRGEETASRRLREQLRSQPGMGHLIGRSPEMERLYRILAKAAQGSHPVLIQGESGVGKELVARTIHAHSALHSLPFILVDCRSLAPALVEGELFGYAKGAFPHSLQAKPGLLASPAGGTLLLDEVGELPLDLQAKLLRALQEKVVCPLGGTTQRAAVNVRILASTHRDLAQMAETAKFRKDLFYRLNVLNLRVPALRDRAQDIPLLAAHFLERASRENGAAYTLSDDSLSAMVEYEWPGNVRELENAVERACGFSTGPLVHLGDLPTQVQNFHLANRRPDRKSQSETGNEPVLPLAKLEKQAILDTLRKLNGDKLLAAKLLGIGKTTLYRKLKEYGIEDTDEAAFGEEGPSIDLRRG